MTEIEKLYKLAKVKKINIAEYGSTYIPNSVKIDDELYPPFTAEKQIELIKWLSKRRLLNITFCENKNTYQLSNNKCTGSFCSDLATAVVTLVQCELDFCTEQEKERIKEILNENS